MQVAYSITKVAKLRGDTKNWPFCLVEFKICKQFSKKKKAKESIKFSESFSFLEDFFTLLQLFSQ